MNDETVKECINQFMDTKDSDVDEVIFDNSKTTEIFHNNK